MLKREPLGRADKESLDAAFQLAVLSGAIRGRSSREARRIVGDNAAILRSVRGAAVEVRSTFAQSLRGYMVGILREHESDPRVVLQRVERMDLVLNRALNIPLEDAHSPTR